MPVAAESYAGVLATATALPRHRYAQAELAELVVEASPNDTPTNRTPGRFFQSVNVAHRHLALPKEAYRTLGGLADRSRAWLEVALELGQRCIEEILDQSGTAPADVGQLLTTTVTGMAVPTLDARLMNRIAFSPSLKRVPCFGLGCVGGAAGVARVADYLRAYSTQSAILLSVELCSLTLQRDDRSISNLISMGLFGDGAAAVLMVGAEHPAARHARPSVVDSQSVFFPGTERMMGWEIVDTGFKVVLDLRVPELAEKQLLPAVSQLLSKHGLGLDDIGAWVCHPGGPKIMEAVSRGLGLDRAALAPARAGLENVGNLSSASVLFLLDEYRKTHEPPPGSWGIMMAMGPAFCAELVLLRW